jgi:D-alanyl-D-alanine-carboxypeptidase/D-alanyl-D-alanine-endopeptidase
MSSATLITMAVVILAVPLVAWVRSDGRDGLPSRDPQAIVVPDGTAPAPQMLRPGDPHAHGITDRQLDELRAILRKAVNDGTVPGVSLLLAHRGEVIFKEAFGDITLDQKIQMASSSKPVTATLLMILVDQGKLALDDPIEKHLPEFRGITLRGKPPAKRPTVRHLLCNMSGLPGDFLWSLVRNRLNANRATHSDAGKDQKQEAHKPEEKDPDKGRIGLFSPRNRSLAESVRAIAENGLATEPGAEFHYCTMGFNVAARVAEVAAGKPFEELVRTELLGPLGMSNTRYIPLGIGALGSKPTLKNGESRFIMAGGGVTSTLDDFAAFYQLHANGGTYNGRRILSERAVREMHTRQGKIELLMSGPYGKDYGLAFFLDRMDKTGYAHTITHPGLFGTAPWLDKDRQVVGVFLVQSNFIRVTPLVHEVQAKVREMIPVIETRAVAPFERIRILLRWLGRTATSDILSICTSYRKGHYNTCGLRLCCKAPD